jgi:predicted Zn-dependent protease
MSELHRPDLARQYAMRARDLGGSDFLFASELSHLESRFALQDGNEEAAEKGFRLSVEREPQSEMFALDLATFLADRGQQQEAIAVIDEAIERAKTHDNLQRLRLEIMDQYGHSGK